MLYQYHRKVTKSIESTVPWTRRPLKNALKQFIVFHFIRWLIQPVSDPVVGISFSFLSSCIMDFGYNWTTFCFVRWQTFSYGLFIGLSSLHINVRPIISFPSCDFSWMALSNGTFEWWEKQGLTSKNTLVNQLRKF